MESRISINESRFSLNYLVGTLTRVTNWLIIVSAILVGVVMLLGVIDVLMTKVFSRPILGFTEATEELTVVINFLAFAYIAITKKDINVSLFDKYMSKGVRSSISILGYVLGTAAIGFLAWRAFFLFQENFTQHIGKPYLANVFYFPLWPGSLVLFIGSCFWFIAFLLLLVKQSVDTIKQ